jgi:hypothetical protein
MPLLGVGWPYVQTISLVGSVMLLMRIVYARCDGSLSEIEETILSPGCTV